MIDQQKLESFVWKYRLFITTGVFALVLIAMVLMQPYLPFTPKE